MFTQNIVEMIKTSTKIERMAKLAEKRLTIESDLAPV
jgi:hypothetical protein